MPAQPGSSYFCGLFRRRVLYLPTWRCWLGLLMISGLLGYLALRHAYTFLAVNHPVPGGALVVEGWASDSALQAALGEFAARPYLGLFVTGGPLEQGAPLIEYHSCAEVGAATLVRLGANPKDVHAVPSEAVRQDRTYASAIALKRTFHAQKLPVKQVNVVSVGAHSRRSWMMFREAFRGEAEVGIIALPDPEFEPDRWWTSSGGFRSVTGEWIAYLYARLVFRRPET